MQPLQQELSPSKQELRPQDHPVFGTVLADQATAHAEEVRLLRQRVAVLESALASAKATQVAATSSPVDHGGHAAVASEFCEQLTPAVVSVSTTTQPAGQSQQSPPATPASQPVSDPGFAQAWTDEAESSFEERLAQKAFFQVGSVDEESRKWLLTS